MPIRSPNCWARDNLAVAGAKIRRREGLSGDDLPMNAFCRAAVNLFVKSCLALWALTLPVWAADSVILRSGQTIEADRVETRGALAILYKDAGAIELDAAAIDHVEAGTPKPASLPAPQIAVPPMLAVAKSPRELLIEAAERHGLPKEFVLAVARAESALRVDARSPKGAIGLMQLMPATAKALHADPYDPAANVDAGVRLLRALLLQYQEDGARALAAYNAGAGAVERYHGVPPYRETQGYVSSILKSYLKEVKAAGGN